MKVNIGNPASALIGKIEQGFDFLGHHFGPGGHAIARKTLDNFVERAIRLYEQGPGEPSGSTRLGEYVQRWVRWAYSGLPFNDATLGRWLILRERIMAYVILVITRYLLLIITTVGKLLWGVRAHATLNPIKRVY